jgi:hypothetical protein
MLTGVEMTWIAPLSIDECEARANIHGPSGIELG